MEEAKRLFLEGNEFFKQGNFDKAKEFYQTAMNLLQLSSQNTEKMHTAHALSNLGLLQFAEGRVQEAKSLHEEALQLRRSMEATADQSISDDIEYLAWDMNRELSSHQQFDRSQTNLISRLKQHDSMDALISDSLNNLGGCLELSGDYEGALQMYSEALELRKILFGESHYLVAEVMQNMATVQSALGHLQQASDTLHTVLKVYEAHYGADSIESAIVLNNIGVVMTQMGMLPKAVDCLDKAYEIRMQQLGDEHPLTQNVKQNLQYTRNKMAGSLPSSSDKPKMESNETSNFAEEKYPFCK